MSRVTRRAKHDLIEHFVYLAENASIEIADRFLESAQSSFNDLADKPKIGAPLSLRHSELAGMRKWSVKDFDDFLIFYLPRSDGVSIVRVLHSAQDWWNLLDIIP